MRKLNSKGFGVIEGLLILVIVGIVGGTGFYVYNANKNTSDGSDRATIVKDEEQADTRGYLVIKEWGVKVPQLPQGNLISYEIDENDKNRAHFVSSEQKALGGDCGEFSSARYSIYKADVGYEPSDYILKAGLDEAVNENLTIEIDGEVYYILGDFSGGACTEESEEGEGISTEELKANDNLLEALKGLVKT